MDEIVVSAQGLYATSYSDIQCLWVNPLQDGSQ